MDAKDQNIQLHILIWYLMRSISNASTFRYLTKKLFAVNNIPLVHKFIDSNVVFAYKCVDKKPIT